MRHPTAALRRARHLRKTRSCARQLPKIRAIIRRVTLPRFARVSDAAGEASVPDAL